MVPGNNYENAALLVMDVQTVTVKMLKDNSPILQALASALHSARSHKIPVIYGVVGFRRGYPEMSPNNKAFATLRKNTTLSLDVEEGFQIYPPLGPQPGEIVVTKKRHSTFTGSDLEVILRSFGIKRLVLTGISTSGVVLSTLREAADKDYAITVLSDCCADSDEEVHRVLTTKVFPRQADVMNSDEWALLLASRTA